MAATYKMSTLLSIIGSAVILSGLYWVIYMVSNGIWIWMVILNLVWVWRFYLSDWRLAFIALFAAQLDGCVDSITSYVDR